MKKILFLIKRFGAYCIDIFIIFIILKLISFIIIFFIDNLELLRDNEELLYHKLVSLLYIIKDLLIILVYILYFSLMESSSLKGTVGKILLGLSVTDVKGRQISFLRALARNLLKIVSSIVIFGYLIVFISRYRQTFHDLVSGCIIGKNIYSNEDEVGLQKY